MHYFPVCGGAQMSDKDYLLVGHPDFSSYHPDFSSYKDSEGDAQLGWIGPIAHVNAFVGATNSGKSRFLRGLARTDRYTFLSRQAIDDFTTMIRICERRRSDGLACQIFLLANAYEPRRTQGIGALQPILEFARSENLNEEWFLGCVR